jgi:acylphosphatase
METSREAARHGVTGWVRNLPDGGVEAVFEGDKNAVDAVVSWCRSGPPLSRVEDVSVTEEPYTGAHKSFDIVY